MMKLSVFLAVIGCASAFSVRGPVAKGARATPGRRGDTVVYEDFGFFGFDKEWENNFDVLSEARLEKALNKEGLRYRMNRTDKETDDVMDLPTIKIGPIELQPPRVASIWEALGFDATGTNEQSLKAKKEWKQGLKDGTYKFARFSKAEREEWRNKYGYDRGYGEQ